MSCLWICHRRAEEWAGPTERIYRRLVARFGAHRIVADGDAFEAREAIEFAAIVVVIRPGWLKAIGRRERAETDTRRLVGSALRRQVGVVPLLIDGAELPSADALPGELAPLADRYALRVDDGAFEADVEQVVRFLESYLPEEFAAEPDSAAPTSLAGDEVPLRAARAGKEPWRLAVVEEWFARARRAGLATIEQRRLARLAARRRAGDDVG